MYTNKISNKEKDYKYLYLKYKKKYLELKNKKLQIGGINEESPLEEIIINFYNNSFFKIVEKNYCDATKEEVDSFNAKLIRDGSQDNLKDLINVDSNINLNKTFLELIEPYIKNLNFICKIDKNYVEKDTKKDEIKESKGLYGKTVNVDDNFNKSLKKEEIVDAVPNLYS